MSEVGSIDFRAERVGGEGGEGAEITRGIGQAGTIAIQAKKEDILGDFKDTVVSDAEDALTNPDTRQPVGATEEGVGIQARLQQLNGVAASGSTSQRQMAILQGKRELKAAQLAHPGMRAELAQEFRSFVSTSSDLDQLGLRDAAGAATANRSGAEFDKIVANARAPMSSGGLGLPFDLDPLSNEFAEKYAWRQDIQRQKGDNAAYMMERSSQTGINLAGKAHSWQTGLKGKKAIIYDNIIGIQETAAETMVMRPGESESDQRQRRKEWIDLGGRDDAIEQVENQVLQLEMGFEDAFTIADKQDPGYAAIRQSKDDSVKSLQRLITAMKSEDPSAMKIWEIEKELAVADLRSDNPKMDTMLTFVEATSDAFKYLETVGVIDDLTKDTLGQAIAVGATDVMRNLYIGSGQGEIPVGATADEIISVQDRDINHESDNNQTGMMGPTAQMASNATQQANVALLATQIDRNTEPRQIQDVLVGLSSAQKKQNLSGVQDRTTVAQQLSTGGNKGTQNAITSAIGATEDLSGALVTYGVGARDTWNNIKPTITRELQSAWTGLIEGAPLNHLLRPSFEQALEGIITFEVDEAALAELSIARMEANPEGSQTGVGFPHGLVSRRRLEDAARTLSRKVSNSIKFVATFETALAAELNTTASASEDGFDYANAYHSSGLAKVFGLPGPTIETPEPTTNEVQPQITTGFTAPRDN